MRILVTHLVLFSVLCPQLPAEEVGEDTATVHAEPDDVVPVGQEHMLPHYGILDIGGATLMTSEDKVLLFVHPTLYVDGKLKQQFGSYPVLLERGNQVQLSMSLMNFGVKWENRIGNEGSLYYVATGYDEQRRKPPFCGRGKFDWPDESSHVIRREEVPLQEKTPLKFGKRTALWAYVGEGVESIDQLSTPREKRGDLEDRAKKADWAVVLFVVAKEPSSGD